MALTGAFTSGCIFDPAKGHHENTKPVLTYDQSTPALTLQTLTTVYTTRDSNLVKQIYDPDYRGTSRDFTDPSQTQPLAFVYVDEVEHVAALAQKPSISRVTFTFGALTRLNSDDLAHPEYALIQMPGNNINFEIDDGPDAYKITSDAGETITFRLKPITPASTPTDTLWKVISWEEIHQASSP